MGRLTRLLDSALDRSVVLSFDRTGFERHARDFVAADLDVDLTGRTALITGANAGLGRAATQALHARGATVILACRDRARGEAARAELGPRAELELVDMSSTASVRALAARLAGRPLDVLIHNAGALVDAYTPTPEGLELTWATHVVGPWLLTQQLMPSLRAGARVIWVSSGGMYTQRLDLERLRRPSPRGFDGVVQYAQAKRAQIILTEQLATRLAAQQVVVHAMHPGWADTGGVRSSLPRFFALTRAILRSPAQGADTIVWLAASARAGQTTGQLWFDRRVVSTHLWPRTEELPGDRARLWDACAEDAARAAGAAAGAEFRPG